MPDPINALASEAASDYPGGTAYSYAAQDVLTARILIVEEGGAAFPQGDDIGAPEDDPTSRWHDIFRAAELTPGMYSWWNAIPCGLDRPVTGADRDKGRRYLNRAIALHADLYVVVAVGSVAQSLAAAASTSARVLKTRSPTRSGRAAHERIRETLVRARLDAYPIGLDTDR